MQESGQKFWIFLQILCDFEKFYHHKLFLFINKSLPDNESSLAQQFYILSHKVYRKFDHSSMKLVEVLDILIFWVSFRQRRRNNF